ncbi:MULTISPECIES: non-heme iron oxygenase ferredoxin subunit [Comamonadaceae]|uniref:non-heme iron oxygenase ferredoxin subunit n=1 Tax=unclassified Acidovorax TaxID=2684926 RepID=UPI00234BAEC3|nr:MULTISPECIES: non-heme iron oxygenase ferredoxin subunit [Comamonadaceae]WCM97666.1 non-heme iron oxygenase ferredoxin subunit [Acidovorax sp. GBBC 1281]WOI46421.1 non-heme iron oxygenase ferredoxin subunit [Paracidovorax avenae]GKS93778.1 non-heme iron oxygenase ferredoxin subunit [Acidovorax sp. SUPP2825]GKS99656.1 non-heme iron oxygenase ferredoxin subunit [Acidovorax sp. SUPP3434]GKT13259.1 non-heme iron oxygenase ferredoxin subunit [Acidovorax sp. SUPP2522]
MPAIDTGWTEATARADLPEDDVVGVTVEGRDVALYTVDGEVFATDNLCTHGNARLCDGFLEGHEIECPLHQGRFDVRDGSALCAPLTQGLRSYPVRVEQGTVYLKLA